MKPPRSITLIDPEVAQVRRGLLHIQHRQQDLLAEAQRVSVIVSRLGEAVAGIEYLLERAEQRGCALRWDTCASRRVGEASRASLEFSTGSLHRLNRCVHTR